MEQAGEVDYLITWRDTEFVGRVSLTPCRSTAVPLSVTHRHYPAERAEQWSLAPARGRTFASTHAGRFGHASSQGRAHIQADGHDDASSHVSTVRRIPRGAVARMLWIIAGSGSAFGTALAATSTSRTVFNLSVEQFDLAASQRSRFVRVRASAARVDPQEGHRGQEDVGVLPLTTPRGASSSRRASPTSGVRAYTIP